MANELKPVSAEYAFENEYETSGKSKKFDFSPVRYDYNDGIGNYSFVHHDAMKNTVSEAFANDTFLGMNRQFSSSSVASNRSVDTVDLCLFTTLIAPNGKYVKNVDGMLHAVTEPTDAITNENIFKIFRSSVSKTGHDISNAEYVISQGDKFATVNLAWNRFDLKMDDLISGDELGIQHFKIVQLPGTSRIAIVGMMKNPWRVTSPDSIKNEFSSVQRFWSLYDGASYAGKTIGISTKDTQYPTVIYLGDEPNRVKLNGCMYNPVWNGTETLKRIGNNYFFVANFLADNPRYITIGYDGKIRWVKYFNSFYDNFFNADVTPDKIIESVEPSIVYECAYKTGIEKDIIKMNMIELKNVMTPSYSYSAHDIPATSEE